MTLEKLANLHEEDHQVHPVKVRGYTYNIYIYMIIYIYIYLFRVRYVFCVTCCGMCIFAVQTGLLWVACTGSFFLREANYLTHVIVVSEQSS